MEDLLKPLEAMLSARLVPGERVMVVSPANRRRGQREVDGIVVYVSRNGWATVALDLGYRESFWLDEIQPVDFSTGGGTDGE
ncbi:MAG: hypothetical protein K6T78_08130 [Alicyclobacillus sp.]|nr:hypothetical protein [Alicyclobacillus sp.]